MGCTIPLFRDLAERMGDRTMERSSEVPDRFLLEPIDVILEKQEWPLSVMVAAKSANYSDVMNDFIRGLGPSNRLLACLPHGSNHGGQSPERARRGDLLGVQ
jgi:hypothetical protein